MKRTLVRFIRGLADWVEASDPPEVDPRATQPREGYREFDASRPYLPGDAVVYDGFTPDNQGYRWYGFSDPRPQLHDVICAPLKSGDTGRFLITFLQLPHDPPDQWFAETKVRLENRPR